MDKREQLETMDKFLRVVDDIKSSETSVLKKITQVEADNINAGINILDQHLPDIHDFSDKLIEAVDKLYTEFSEYRDQFVKDNKLEDVDTVASES